MAKAKGFRSKQQGGMISIDSMVGHRTSDAAVVLRWGKESSQLTTREARDHAYAILQVAMAVELDACLVHWLTQKLNVPLPDAAAMLRLFRQARLAGTLPSMTLNLEGDRYTPDELRQSAEKMLEMAFGSEAEGFLVKFCLEELGVTEQTTDQILQEFREMRGATTLWRSEH